LGDRHLAAAKEGHLVGVDVHARHPMPQVGKAGCAGQSDIARADDTDREPVFPVGPPWSGGRPAVLVRHGTPPTSSVGAASSTAGTVSRSSPGSGVGA